MLLATTYVFEAPSWLDGFIETGKDVLLWLGHNWSIILGVFIVAVLGSIVTELRKRHYNTKKLEELSKKAVTWWLVASSTAFTAIGYFIWFAGTERSVLESLPIIGQHVVEAVGVATTMYNLQFKKYYVAFSVWAQKFTKQKAPVPKPQVVPSQSSDETAENFVV